MKKHQRNENRLQSNLLGLRLLVVRSRLLLFALLRLCLSGCLIVLVSILALFDRLLVLIHAALLLVALANRLLLVLVQSAQTVMRNRSNQEKPDTASNKQRNSIELRTVE